jgi:hypothetical protein
MKTSRIAALSVLSFALAASFGVQADTLTRAQVKAELAEAQRTGNLPDHELGTTLNQAFPRSFPAQVQVPVVQVQPAVQPVHTVQAATPATGDIEYDAIAQRSAQALARRTPVAEDARFAAR